MVSFSPAFSGTNITPCFWTPCLVLIAFPFPARGPARLPWLLTAFAAGGMSEPAQDGPHDVYIFLAVVAQTCGQSWPA